MRGPLTWLAALFRPQGSLLVQPIEVEVNLYLLGAGQHKAMVSKFEDSPEQGLAQRLIQALIFTAIDVARERHISINWAAVAQRHPPYPEHAAGLGPPAPAPGG